MILKILGSSSAGNCYILENDTEALIIEAGVNPKEVKKALDFNISKVIGVIVSHEHGDHAKYIRDFALLGITVYMPNDSKKYEWVQPIDVYPWTCGFTRDIGNFHITTFENVHSVPCYGFYIQHPDIGNLVFATDTEYIKYRFKDINHLLVEANYSKELLKNDSINRDHVITGHMELQTTLDFIHANDNSNLNTVCLLHLSDKNSDSAMFSQLTKDIVPYADVYIADAGMEIELNKDRF